MRSGFVNRAGITYDALKLDRFYAEDLNAIAAVINATSGTNTGDETLASIKSKLGAANTGSDGYLTATDWNIFNNKISSRWSANTQGIYYNGNVSLGATVGNILTVYGYSDSANKYGIGTLGDGSGGNPYRMPFYANGAECGCVTSSGNWGFGRIPGTRVDVAGIIRSSDSTYAGYDFHDGTNLQWQLLSQGNDSNSLAFWENGTTRRLILKEGGWLGINTSPSARLDVNESIALGNTSGDYQILSRFTANVGNAFMNNVYTVRSSSSGGWTTAVLHDALSIDASFLTPRSNTRTWWERDPSAETHSFGSSANIYLTLSSSLSNFATLVKATGYKSSDGSDGATEFVDIASTRLTFKNGLFIEAGGIPV